LLGMITPLEAAAMNQAARLTAPGRLVDLSMFQIKLTLLPSDLVPLQGYMFLLLHLLLACIHHGVHVLLLLWRPPLC